eukprot:760482-Hanusia_phi.AAC.3
MSCFLLLISNSHLQVWQQVASSPHAVKKIGSLDDSEWLAQIQTLDSSVSCLFLLLWFVEDDDDDDHDDEIYDDGNHESEGEDKNENGDGNDDDGLDAAGDIKASVLSERVDRHTEEKKVLSASAPAKVQH